MPPGNLELLGSRVAGEFDHLQAVAQSRVDRVKPVGRGDEQYPRQIIRHVQVIVGKGVVLGGIKHLKQRCGRVAAIIGADLVQFIQQNNGIARFSAPERLNNSAGQRPDIRAPVSANLNFITHAAQGNARKLATKRVGHTLAQRRFSNSRWSHKAQNRTFQLLLQFDDGEKLKQPVLDLGETEMVAVEQLRGVFDVKLVFGKLGPRQVDQPIKVVARHGVFRDRWRHLLEPIQFLKRNFPGFLGQIVLFDQLA